MWMDAIAGTKYFLRNLFELLLSILKFKVSFQYHCMDKKKCVEFIVFVRDANNENVLWIILILTGLFS